jgi:hypothetical protein
VTRSAQSKSAKSKSAQSKSAPSTSGRARFALLAAAALVTLTGCGAMHPGVAAVVGSSTITDDQVDALAKGLCSANAQSAATGGAPVASRGARQGALQVLIDSALAKQFGEKKGVTPDRSMVSAALAQNEQGVAMLPEDEQPAFRAALKDYAEGRLMLAAVGRRSLEAQGKTGFSDQEALAEGERLLKQYTGKVDIEVDPRFGSYRQGSLQPNSSDLSVPVSQSARQGANANPGAAWVSQLPATQKCT